MDGTYLKEFFPKEVSLGKGHVSDCSCEICLESEDIFEKLVLVCDQLSSNQVEFSNSKQVCSHLNADLLEGLSCANSLDFQEQLDKYYDTHSQITPGQPLNKGHDGGCKCAICCLKNDLESKLDEFCSNKYDYSDFLEIIDEKDLRPSHLEGSEGISTFSDDYKKGCKKEKEEVKSYLVCGSDSPVILMTRGSQVESALDANTQKEIVSAQPNSTNLQIGEGNDSTKETPKDYFENICDDVQQLSLNQDNLTKQASDLRPVGLEEMVDICLCERGKISSYCLKHSIAYSQHMQTKLYNEGCTCTKESECLFCQRLKCCYCSHERLPDPCTTLSDEKTDELSYNVSKWLDKKLLTAGVAQDVIEKFSEPLKNHKPLNYDHGVDISDDDIYKQVGLYLENVIKENASCNMLNPADHKFTVNDKMREEMLDMNQLFDIRTFPRCYRLKGVKNGEGIYCDIEEEMMELGFEAWKVPTQFVEETFPLSSTSPDLEIRLDKEEEIRKRTRNQRSSAIDKNVKIKGLSDDWRPIVQVCSDQESDYTEILTYEQKQQWAQKTYEEIMDKCKGAWKKQEENPIWSKVQPILNKYCEEVVPKTNFDVTSIDLDNILEKGAEFAERMFKQFPKSSNIGYKPEFWNGLENWKPDESENEVRKQLNDEVQKFIRELDSFKNDFERALRDCPGIETNPEAMLNELILSLPESTRSRVIKLISELPSDWMENPQKYLNNLNSGSKITFTDVKLDTPKLDRVSECITDSESLQDFEDEDYDIGDRKFFYDDEENDEATKESEIEKADERKEPESGLSGIPSIVKPDTTASGTKSKLNHKPAPYVVKMKEEMLKNSPDGLHPAQKVWYDKPMFPFWTPSVVYDLSEIDQLFFDGVPDYNPDLSDFQIKEIERRLFERSSQSVTHKADLILEEDVTPLPDDEVDTTAVEVDTKITKKSKKMGSAENDGKKSKKKSKKTISDEDCLIKEDDFKVAIEQLLTAQNAKKENEKDQGSGEAGGALSLDHIVKGVGGRVKTRREGAIELDSSKDINLESVVPLPALVFKFKLDTFQKQAIIALEAGLSVFVAAHTSAGKTVAAEYAIAMAQRNGCRVVYTSPIKALSNQKYNDFSKKFKGQMKVGIITGDVQLNKEAECLIMTTEILRSMLYNQSSILSDLEFVIFDEVHYFNDPERGNVWEEVLILLPHQCQLVMLSATVPNVMKFASWVGTLRKREVIVTTTYKRPVPLKHYIHYSTHPKHVARVMPVREAEGNFLIHNFEKAIAIKQSLQVDNIKKGGNRRILNSKEWIRFIRGHLQLHGRLPAVVFCFSRKRCDELASDIQGHIDLVEDAKKKKHIENFFNRQINMLQPQDREIQQIVTMKGLLQKGIGVHHSGILPILKEIVEVLFSESQIKLLFATETFAMGVNMPAKTVVFQQVCKFDGVESRALKPGEYTQMAGRAGRRNTDKSGTVIITEWNDMDKCVTADDLKEMLTGSVDPLESQFRLRYSMILTALKPEGENSIQSIIQKSFFDFSLKARQTKTNELGVQDQMDLSKVHEEMRSIPQGLRDRLLDYCSISNQFLNHHDAIRKKMFEHRNFKQYLNIGRLVTISYQRYANVFGIILGENPSRTSPYDIVVMKSSLCLINSIKEMYPEASDELVNSWYRAVGFRKYQLLPSNHLGRIEPQESLELIQCKPLHIMKIVKNCIYKINKGLAGSIVDTLQSTRRQYNPGVDGLMQFFLHSLQNMHNMEFLKEEDITFNQPLLREEVMNYHKLSQAFDEHLYHVKLPSLHEYPLLQYMAVCFWFEEKRKAVERRKIAAQKEELTSLFDDFESKLIFLKNNKYIKENDDVVDTKGRIASRMTNFEVFVTEILLKNVLEDLDGPETAALLSCLVIPGVNTECNDHSNKENPLFEKIEEDEFPTDNVSAGRGKRGDMKKVMEKLRKTEKELDESKKKEQDEKKKSIRQYLELTPALHNAIKIVNDIRIDLMSQEKVLDIQPMEGADLNKITFYLVPIVYAWAQGKAIRDIMKVLVPTIQEGILVRWIINLNETIKDIDSATHHFLKDSRIKEKFDSASNSIKRGIIDTPSLYLNQRTQAL